MAKNNKKSVIAEVFAEWLAYLDHHRIQARIWVSILSIAIGISLITISIVVGKAVGQAAVKMFI